MPFEQSQLMAEQLALQSVEHELVAIPGAEHGLTNADPQQIDRAHERAVEFLSRYLQR